MALYHSVKIGNLTLDGNLFLAPIAGYSDRAFRSLCVENGASYCTTEMVSAEALTRGSQKTAALMARAPSEKAYAVQIFGGNADVMADAAKIVLETTECTSIDINGGCPVPKIIKSGAGSSLTRDPDLLYAIVSSVKNAAESYASLHPERGNVPVTIKIRSGWDANHLTWKECAEAALSARADAITIHARTRAQGYEGKADWSLLAELVEFIDGRIPVFASGDIFSPENVKACFEQTGVDGVMFARGAMGNPFIFDETKRFLLTGEHYSTPPNIRISAGMEELDILISLKGEQTACREMRKRFCAYSKGLDKASQMRSSIVSANTRADFAAIFADYLS
ncbi:MAG: tRNA dihydrouridine synthase DusB [Spirochaetaceae bacterium]|nr:tRNA dihydrouridine synthase DusB [Spirochaetaceae bacterium]